MEKLQGAQIILYMHHLFQKSVRICELQTNRVYIQICEPCDEKCGVQIFTPQVHLYKFWHVEIALN